MGTSPPSKRHDRNTPLAVRRKRLQVEQNGADIALMNPIRPIAPGN